MINGKHRHGDVGKAGLVAALLCGLAGATLLILNHHTPNDDAYITFRHARHFAEHGLLSWNLSGDRELGSTTPLYALLLGIIGVIFGGDSMPQISLYLNAALMIVAAPIYYKLALRFSDSRMIALAVCGLISVNSYNIRIFAQGFEAPLFNLMFFGGIFALLERRYGVALLAAGLAPLVRPEGVFLSVVAAIILIVRRDLHPRMAIAYSLAPLLWLLFAFWMYGSPIPQSVQAKQADAVLRPLFGMNIAVDPVAKIKLGLQTLVGAWDILLKPIVLINSEAALALVPDLPYKPGNGFLKSGNNLLYALVVTGVFLVVRMRQRGDLLALVSLSYPIFLILFILFVRRVEFWYLPIWSVSALLWLALGFFALFQTLADWGAARWQQRGVLLRRIAYGLAAVVIVLLLGKNIFIFNDGKRAWDDQRGAIYVPAPRDSIEFERYHGYRLAAETLNERNRHRKDQAEVQQTLNMQPRTPELPRGLVAMTDEVGVFGYYYEESVIDLFGLCSDEVIEIFKQNYVPGQLTPSYEPAVRELRGVYLMGAWMRPMLESAGTARFLTEAYRVTDRLPYTVVGEPLEIWELRSIPPTNDQK